MKKLFLILCVLFSICTSGVFASGGGEKGSGKMTFGVTFDTFDDAFMQGVKDAVEKTGKTMGIKLVLVDAKSDSAEQIKQVDNFITVGLDAIIVHAITQDISPTITQKALDADIPLVYMNRAPSADALPAGAKVAVVASPEEQAGIGQAKYVIDRLGKKGNGVILLGTLGSTPQIGRTKGVKDYLAANASGFNIIREQTASWKRPDAVQVVENWLASGDTIHAVFANNDEMAIGAALALKERGLKDSVIVVGVDASPDGIAALESGDIDMTMFQNGRAQGSGSIEVAAKMAKGESFEQNVVIPFEPVTLDNVDQYK